jgi:hydroxyethylthiazole kinase-like uncharacterized protein yjeF
MRAAEQRAMADGISEAVLIDRASTAVARRAIQLLGRVYGARVVVLAGKGHNGADALWAAWKLRQRGAHVDVVLTGGLPNDDHGLTPLGLLRDGGAQVADDVLGAAPLLRAADLVLDGMLGIGATGELRDPVAGISGLIDRTAVLAVDIPTGVDADTGAVATSAVRADVTVTFGCLKPGLVVGRGAELSGAVEVADIGLQWPDTEQALATILDADDVGDFLDRYAGEADATKYSRGVVGVVAGSAEYAGAALLACAGAVRAGAGMVRLHADDHVGNLVRSVWPEVVVVAPDPATDQKVDAWVVGPGLGTDDRAMALLKSVLDSALPVVVDADAISLAAREPAMLKREAPTVVTPHTGEFERLTGVARAAAEADRIGVTRGAAASTAATVLLKGTTTVITDHDGFVFVNPTGSSALATAGTGDVLSGAIGTLLAVSGSSRAAVVAAWLHGLAGRIASDNGAQAITASDVAAALPEAVRRVRATRG